MSKPTTTTAGSRRGLYSTFDADGMQTKEEARSPSGEGANSVYTENYKDQCTGPTVVSTARPVRPHHAPAPFDASLLLIATSAAPVGH